MVEQVVSLDELERLFVNNEQLDQLGAYLNRFNPIRTMRMENMEVRHSAILTWLLNPTETHGFGDRFLKAFLSEALRGQSGRGHPTALDVAQSDLRDAEIRREWQNIDVFIISRRNGWAFVIENKYYASQHENQLSKYVARVKSIFEPQGLTLTVRGVFLTLLEEEPQDPTYVTIRYDAICDLLPRLIALEGLTLGQEVAMFLGHYLEVIRAAGMSAEHDRMKELARQLYRTHKKALDFVIENGATTDFVLAAESTFMGEWEWLGTMRAGVKSYMYSAHDSRKISFVPTKWASGFGGEEFDWPGCENWWAGYPLICWIELFDNDDGQSGALKLFAEVGPIADREFRSSLIAAIKAIGVDSEDRIRFQQGADRDGKKYSKFLRNNIIEISDVHDSDEIARAMNTLLDRFEQDFDRISGVLPRFLAYGKG